MQAWQGTCLCCLHDAQHACTLCCHHMCCGRATWTEEVMRHIHELRCSNHLLLGPVRELYRTFCSAVGRLQQPQVEPSRPLAQPWGFGLLGSWPEAAALVPALAVVSVAFTRQA